MEKSSTVTRTEEGLCHTLRHYEMQFSTVRGQLVEYRGDLLLLVSHPQHDHVFRKGQTIRLHTHRQEDNSRQNHRKWLVLV